MEVRATIRSILAAARLNCTVDTVELLVSEVVTNAYRCSAQETYVSMERTPEDFRVTVWDHGAGAPTLRTPSDEDEDEDEDEHGRGLGIVETCADLWGVRDYPGSFEVKRCGGVRGLGGW